MSGCNTMESNQAAGQRSAFPTPSASWSVSHRHLPVVRRQCRMMNAHPCPVVWLRLCPLAGVFLDSVLGLCTSPCALLWGLYRNTDASLPPCAACLQLTNNVAGRGRQGWPRHLTVLSDLWHPGKSIGPAGRCAQEPLPNLMASVSAVSLHAPVVGQ